MSGRRFAGLLMALCLLPGAVRATDALGSITVFAANSLTDVLQEIGDAYTKATGTNVVISFEASSMLAHQIESGAHADVFVSADQGWMDYLDQRGLIQKGTRRDLVGNRLALIAPADSPVHLKIEPGYALLAALKGGRLVTGDPDSVPVGRYARAALISLGVWKEVADQLVLAASARNAVAFVARGEAPLGIVYRTDALIEKRVRIVDLFPPATHPPIIYLGALTVSANVKAGAFLDFLRGPKAATVFERYGFIVPN